MIDATKPAEAGRIGLACDADDRHLAKARLINPAFRLADRDDIATICDLRCAQSLEYWDRDEAFDTASFRQATEAYLDENLGTRILFGVIEDASEVVSISGLEMNDRLPTIGAMADAGFSSERSATIVSCYTPKEHRGRGYMGQMLDIWMSLATLFNVDALYLESHNPSMQRMAASNGYEMVSSKFRLALEGGGRHAEALGTTKRARLDD